MCYFTGKGDEGRSSLADGRQLSKGELVFELIGTLDEVTAHIGMAISLSRDSDEKNMLQEIQNHLSRVMGLIAGVTILEGENGSFLPNALAWLEEKIIYFSDSIENHKGFLFAGKSSVGASIDIARTVVRRAERQSVRYYKRVEDNNRNDLLIYLNRLSSFLFLFRLFIDHKSNSQEL